jgi:hypothetical protein
MTVLKSKSHHMAQIKSQQNNNDMQHPPAGFVSHEMFQHVISIAYGPVYRQEICPISVLSTSLFLKNLSSLSNSLFPYHFLPSAAEMSNQSDFLFFRLTSNAVIEVREFKLIPDIAHPAITPCLLLRRTALAPRAE